MRKNIVSVGLLVTLLTIGALTSNVKEERNTLEVRDVLVEDYHNEASGRLIRREANEVASNKLSNLKAQISSVNDNGTRHIRFVVALDSYLYENVTFTITVNNGEETRTLVDNEAVTTAYTHLIAAGETLSASDAFGEGYAYLVAYTINNVPESAWEFEFSATVSARAEGYNEDVVTSATRVISDMIALEEDAEYKYDVWDGTVASQIAIGTGTEEDPYVLNSGAELAFVSQNSSNATYSKAYYKLGRDLDLNNNSWTPIGSSVAFGGTFDGNGKSIIGLNVNISTGTVGLFGLVNSACIENLDVTGTTGSSSDYNSILVARAAAAIIRNCVTRGSITSSNQFAGGIVSIVNNGAAGTKTIIDNCTNYADITASDYGVGGIAGYLNSNAVVEISNCRNYGDMNYTSHYVGGIVGRALKVEGSFIKNCYNFGDIIQISTTSVTTCGGIIGDNTILVENCYNYENAKINGYSGLAGTAVFSSDIGTPLSTKNAMICGYFRSDSTTDAGFVNCGICDENGNVILSGDTDIWTGSAATSIALGTGTEEDPYQISSGAELAFVAQKVNAKDTTYASAYYKLTKNLHLNNTNWTPIGLQTNPFQGHFDGNEKTIMGLSVVRAGGTGLFGHIADAYISNVNVIGNIDSTNVNSGMLVGRGQVSTISNCTTRGTINSTAGYVGTIAASANNYQDGVSGAQTKMVIKNCTNYATVNCTATGTTYVGGIISAHNVAIELDGCTNYGSVTSTASHAGGIIGTTNGTFVDSVIKNCSNYGDITSANSAYTGGIAGVSAFTLENCYVDEKVKINGVANS